ncbi:MAG: hypothetical protein Q8Q12_22300 [bacterium]|nr:hypothetical protein [bacterium]
METTYEHSIVDPWQNPQRSADFSPLHARQEKDARKSGVLGYSDGEAA